MSARRWLELRVRVGPGGRAELVPDVLIALGARGVVEEADRFTAYFEEPPDVAGFLARARAALTDDAGPGGVTLRGGATIEHRWQDHEAWEESWKRGLGPRRITPRIIVRPSWTDPGELRPDDVVIVVDPGMAFGTAEHGTTRGCLRLLDGLVRPGDRVLDVGAGSGILSIAAVSLGAAEATAVEGDPLACEALRENLRLNGVDGRIGVVQGWLTAGEIGALGPVDGVVANIETGRLLPLLPGLTAAMAPHGWLVVSGILDAEWGAVASELERRGFECREVDADGEWRSGAFRPRG